MPMIYNINFSLASFYFIKIPTLPKSGKEY